MAKKNFYLHSLRILILYLQLKRFELCRKLFVCCRAGKKLNEVNNKENKLNFTFYLGGGGGSFLGNLQLAYLL